jgi:hypothetical protein
VLQKKFDDVFFGMVSSLTFWRQKVTKNAGGQIVYNTDLSSRFDVIDKPLPVDKFLGYFTTSRGVLPAFLETGCPPDPH